MQAGLHRRSRWQLPPCRWSTRPYQEACREPLQCLCLLFDRLLELSGRLFILTVFVEYRVALASIKPALRTTYIFTGDRDSSDGIGTSRSA
jgi:hypothetical protein